jgi:hypothetical protein
MGCEYHRGSYSAVIDAGVSYRRDYQELEELEMTKGGLWILPVLAALILSSCVSTPQKLPLIDYSSALSPRPVASFHKDFTEADQALFRFLRAMLPTPGENDIVVLAQPFDYHDLVWRMAKTSPGGFLLVEIGEYLGFSNHLKRKGWELMPFHWREFWMYRKPMDRYTGRSA